MDITIGQELSKEDWKAARDHLQVAFIAIADMLERKNYEGKGKEDKKRIPRTREDGLYRHDLRGGIRNRQVPVYTDMRGGYGNG